MAYCTYNRLNMFPALLCPSSGARNSVCYYRLWCAVLGCWLLEVRYRAAGYVLGLRDVAWLELSNIPHPERIAGCPASDLQQPATKASHTIGANNTHIVLSSWRWTLKCPKHVEHAISVINHSVASSWFFFSTHEQNNDYHSQFKMKNFHCILGYWFLLIVHSHYLRNKQIFLML
jgi:hypothetical protein